MSRILAYTSPARGHLFPLTRILLELAARGHDVYLRTLAAEVEPMRALGFDAAPIDPRVEAIALEDWKAKGSRGRLAGAMACFGARANLDGPDVASAIANVRPDALIVDTNAWGAQAAAEAWGGPWASLVPYPVPLSSVDAPPFGLGLPPARGWAGWTRDRAVRPFVLGALERATLPGYNAVRAGYGLRPFASADDQFLAPPLTLYLTAEPFDYPRSDWPSSFALIGPCDWEPPQEAPEWLAEVDRPLLLVTTSSEYQGDELLARTALSAFADGDFFVVVTVPSADPLSFPVPPNARVERYLPHGAVLDRAVCAVTHGGMGATQKALARGVPVCAVPFGRDQFEVARRVEVSGAGARLPGSRLTPDRLRAGVHEALSRRDGARRVASAFAAAGGPKAGSERLESLISLHA
jgi:MGT family glycosyltransferase